MAERIGLEEGDIGEIMSRAVGEVKVQMCEKRKAMKMHECSECGEPIYFGDFYLHFSWRDDDGFHYFKTHLPEECW